jgi:hypothetical protein
MPTRKAAGQWLAVWLKEYCIAVKPRTLISYESAVNYRIKPALGRVRLCKLPLEFEGAAFILCILCIV